MCGLTAKGTQTMSNGEEDDTAILVHDRNDSGSFGEWNPPANPHFDEACCLLREDPAGVERMATAIDRELDRRWALFGVAPNATP